MFNCDEYNLKRFAFVLSKLRKSFGLTQKELAKAAGCKQFDITRYENAKMYPQNDGILDRLGKALGMDPYYLKYGMSALGGGSVRKTSYGKEIELHHFDIDYDPKYVMGKIPSLTEKAEIAKDDKRYMELIQDFLSQMSVDEKVIVLETVVLLNRLHDDNVQVLEESQKEWEKSIGSSERRRRVFPDWLIDMSDSISNKDQTDK